MSECSKWICIIKAATFAVFGFTILLVGCSAQPTERDDISMDGKIEKTDEQWREALTPEQYHVTRKKGTEPAFSGEYWNTKDAGVYQCVCCGQSLFDSKTKFDSGTGWPSYYDVIDAEHVGLHADNSWFAKRTEVTCSRCGAHLGHVFRDGPAPTGLRYCINSASLKLAQAGETSVAESAKSSAKAN